jgi:hypothetical protein
MPPLVIISSNDYSSEKAFIASRNDSFKASGRPPSIIRALKAST